MSQVKVEQKRTDLVAEVLKDLSAGRPVSKDDASKALAQYNVAVKAAKEEKEQAYYRAIEKKDRELQSRNEEISKLRYQLEEVRLRLSKLAGDKMAADNPDLTDLSDPYRPTKLVELFKQVYDDDWSHAFEDLERTRLPERKIIGILEKILKDAELFCEKAAEQQIEGMVCDSMYMVENLIRPKFKNNSNADPVTSTNAYELSNREEKTIRTYINLLRKALARTSVTGLTQIFANCHLKNLVKPDITPCNGINNFVKKIIDLLWMMKIQEVQMVLLWPKENDKFDKNMFTEYTRTGDIIEYTVWPGVLLFKNGSLMSKGVVQCKPK